MIVGKAPTSSSSASERAFRWTPNKLQDLQKALANAGLSSVQGWTLKSATGISADGTVIVGYGRDPSGAWQAFRAT